MQIQMVLVAFASTVTLLLSSTAAHADPDKDESLGKERREGRGIESRDERKHEYTGNGKDEHKDRHGKDEHKDRRDKDKRHGEGNPSNRTWFHDHGHANFRVPDGHLPPLGECRQWYPDRPAGHQPPPGKCSALSHRVPAGAWLVRRPDGQPQNVGVTVYDQRRPGVVLSAGIFDAQTGSFIRLDGSK